MSSGPTPESGDKAPISTWYRPLNSFVFSMAATFVRVLDHAHDAPVPPLVRAVVARVDVGDVVTDRAVGDPHLHVADRLEERLDVVPGLPEQVEGQTLRAFGSDAGKPLELLDQRR